MNPGGAQPMTGAVQDVENLTTWSRHVGAKAGRCQNIKNDAE